MMNWSTRHVEGAYEGGTTYSIPILLAVWLVEEVEEVRFTNVSQFRECGIESLGGFKNLSALKNALVSFR